jgi:hypothetical protein
MYIGSAFGKPSGSRRRNSAHVALILFLEAGMDIMPNSHVRDGTVYDIYGWGITPGCRTGTDELCRGKEEDEE